LQGRPGGDPGPFRFVNGPPCNAASTFPTSGMHGRPRSTDHGFDADRRRVEASKGGSLMVALLLWILGVPGLIILLLLLLGVIHL
jgi:hypothetical protein